MSEDEFFEKYVVGNEGNIEDPQIQEMWIDHGLTDVLIESLDIFTNKDVIEKILSSDIWKEGNYILKNGKIKGIKLLQGKELIPHLYEASIDFESENEVYTMKGLCNKDNLSKYINQPISVIAEKEENKNLRFCSFLKEDSQ